jgi:hypothetical protein
MFALTRPVSAVLVASSLVIGALAATTPQAASATCEYWGYQPRNPLAGDTELLGVETASPCETWVVGYTTDPTTGRRRTLIEKWDGQRWEEKRISNSGDVTTGAIAGGTLYDLAAYSKTNMWAVGHFSIPGLEPASLFVRWNGTKWQRYQTPVDDPLWESEIFGVAAVSSKSYWAVGRTYDSNEEEYRAVIFHWNGNKEKWAPTTIDLPDNLEGIDMTLNAVAVPPSAPPWAVGSFAGIGNRRRTLALRWNRKVWKRVDTPNIDFSNNVLTGASSMGSYTWASGFSESTQTENSVTPLLLRWNGSQWKRATVSQSGEVRIFSDVVVTGGGSFASGEETCIVNCNPDKTVPLVFRWNDRDKTWVRSPSISIGTEHRLHAIDASVNKNVWVVGSYREGPEGPLRAYAYKGGICC